jgi:hypothetical protein
MPDIPEGWPGKPRTIAIADLPLASFGIHSALVDYYDLDETGESNFDNFINTTMDIESEGGLVNPNSHARGRYQWMSPPGEGQNAFQTALKRVEKTYVNFGMDVPEWVGEAREHGNPLKLSEGQERDLFLANLWKQMGTDKLFRGVSEGDPESALKLYIDHHHTRSGPKKDLKRAIKRARGFYGRNYGHGGLVRDAYGRTLF